MDNNFSVDEVYKTIPIRDFLPRRFWLKKRRKKSLEQYKKQQKKQKKKPYHINIYV